MEAKSKIAHRELNTTRTLNAPLEIVWQVWAHSRHIAQWWSPKGFTIPVCDWDAKPGNKILVHMLGPDGKTYPMDGEFKEVIKPKKLVFTGGALDANGKRLFEQLTTIYFIKLEDKTKYELHVTVSKVSPEAEPYLAGMDEGWKQTLDKLEAYLAKQSK